MVKINFRFRPVLFDRTAQQALTILQNNICWLDQDQGTSIKSLGYALLSIICKQKNIIHLFNLGKINFLTPLAKHVSGNKLILLYDKEKIVEKYFV